jgi:hypothetical protein
VHFPFHRAALAVRDIVGLEVTVRSGWNRAVQPSLQVFVARCREGGSRELLCIESVRWLLGGIGAYGKRTGNSLGPEQL